MGSAETGARVIRAIATGTTEAADRKVFCGVSCEDQAVTAMPKHCKVSAEWNAALLTQAARRLELDVLQDQSGYKIVRYGVGWKCHYIFPGPDRGTRSRKECGAFLTGYELGAQTREGSELCNATQHAR